MKAFFVTQKFTSKYTPFIGVRFKQVTNLKKLAVGRIIAEHSKERIKTVKRLRR